MRSSLLLTSTNYWKDYNVTGMWHVYLLFNPKTNRTYIGSTVDVPRRLRQHNREIVGGARSTTRGAPHWAVACYLSGFSTRSSACRWERILKCRARGLEARRSAFHMLHTGVCPPGRAHYEPPRDLSLTVRGIIVEKYAPLTEVRK